VSIIRDVFAGGAERDAAAAREQGIDRATDEQRRQFDLTRGDLAPAVDAGNLAREEELALLGLRGADAEADALSRFQESPGQAFLRERRERAIMRNSAAVGGLRGGNVLRRLNEEGIAMANLQLGERKDRLRGVASGGDATNINRAAIGSNISGNISNLMARRGDVTAAGKIGSANQIRNSIMRVAQAFTGTGGFG